MFQSHREKINQNKVSISSLATFWKRTQGIFFFFSFWLRNEANFSQNYENGQIKNEIENKNNYFFSKDAVNGGKGDHRGEEDYFEKFSISTVV